MEKSVLVELFVQIGVLQTRLRALEQRRVLNNERALDSAIRTLKNQIRFLALRTGVKELVARYCRGQWIFCLRGWNCQERRIYYTPPFTADYRCGQLFCGTRELQLAGAELLFALYDCGALAEDRLFFGGYYYNEFAISSLRSFLGLRKN